MKQNEDPRERIIDAAIGLLADGRESVTTRAVADAAKVQAPTIYRLFGDKEGLLDAVAEHGFLLYLRKKPPLESTADSLEALRHGWDIHIEFGLSNPAIFTLMYGEPSRHHTIAAAARARAILQAHIHALAVAGLLCVSERRAADLVSAAGCGTVLMLLAMPPEERDLALSEAAREAAIAAITQKTPVARETKPAAAAIALAAQLETVAVLSTAEKQLMKEWLERIAEDD